MELLLNLVWLLVAVAAIAAWLRQNRRGGSAGRVKVWLQMVALGCALAVLFPAISATDDLHAAQLAVEASDVARKVLRSMSTSSSHTGALDWLHFLPAILLVAVVATLKPRFIGATLEACALQSGAEFSPLFEGRAPPARLAASVFLRNTA